MPIISAFLVGVVFALGLGISGMTQPEKVIGFLDFTGSWDASLMFVMGGAVMLYFLFFRVLRGERPMLAKRFRLPTRRTIDRRLVGGAALFGVGWALAGFCPGPAITSLGAGGGQALLFVAAMAGGMILYNVATAHATRVRSRSSAATDRTPAQPVSIMLPRPVAPGEPAYGNLQLATSETQRSTATQS